MKIRVVKGQAAVGADVYPYIALLDTGDEVVIGNFLGTSNMTSALMWVRANMDKISWTPSGHTDVDLAEAAVKRLA